MKRILQSNWMRDKTVKPNQKRYSQILCFLDDYLHAKDLKDCWVSSVDIDGKKILQSHLMRRKTGHTQPNFSFS